MIENKFDIITVQKYKEDFDKLFYMINDLLYGIGSEKIDKEDFEVLISSFKDVVRLSSMYNDIVQQVIEDKKIIIEDPQEYIGNNLTNACNLTQSIYRKYKHLSQFDK